MNLLRGCLLALPLLAFGGSAAQAGTNLSGNYLLTLSGHPGISAVTACATLVEDGSTLGFTNSGSVTLTPTGSSSSATGVWFTQKFGATFVVNLVDPSGNSVYLGFNGLLGAPTIRNSTWIELINGTAIAGGTFTSSVKGGC